MHVWYHANFCARDVIILSMLLGSGELLPLVWFLSNSQRLAPVASQTSRAVAAFSAPTFIDGRRNLRDSIRFVALFSV